MELDFSILTDDQLLQLLKLAIAEAIKRGDSIKAAAQAEVLSAQERAAIEFEVAVKLKLEQQAKERERIAKEAEARLRQEQIKKEAQNTENTWSIKAAAIAAVREWGYENDFSINIWSRGADRRVYLQGCNTSARDYPDGSKDTKGDWSWCLFVTGNRTHPPGELYGEGAKCWFDTKQDQLTKFLSAIAESWQGDVKIPSATGNVQPSEKYLKFYLKAIGIEENEKTS